MNTLLSNLNRNIITVIYSITFAAHNINWDHRLLCRADVFFLNVKRLATSPLVLLLQQRQS